jgi:putative ABC transport system permease protein
VGKLARILAARRENVLQALRAIRENKLRSVLTCLGVIIGVATVILMVSLIQGFNRQFIRSFQSFGATLVQFQRFDERFGGGPPPEEEQLRPNLTLDDADAIRRIAWAVRFVSPERWQYQNVDIRFREQRTQNATVGGVTHIYPDANNHWVQRGRFFSAGEELHAAQVAVIGIGVAEALFGPLDPLGRTIAVNGRPFEVIGVFEKKGGFLDGGGADQQMVIPMGMFDRIWPDSKRTYGCVIATIPHRPEWVELAIDQGTAILRDRRGLRFWQPTTSASARPTGRSAFRQITGGVSAAMIVIAESLIIGGVGVMNIMLMNVTRAPRDRGAPR